MLNALIRFSLAQRGLVLMVAVVLLFFGIKKTQEMPVDVLPDLTKPTITLLTEAKGYAPEEVETLVTIPLENSLMGVTGVDRIRSTNDIGLSLIFVEFDWGTDIYQARQFVQERLMGVGESLPEGVTPYMTPVTSLMGDIMLVGLRDTTGRIPPRDLRETADWVVARRLQSIKGIAEVLAMGGGVKQLQIQPDPERMLLQQVTYEEIRQAAAEAVGNTTGGFLTERPEEIMVRNLAMTTAPDVIGETVVAYRQDRPIHLRDVATVTWDVEAMRGDAGFGVAGGVADDEGNLSRRGVVLSVRKSPGFNTLDLDKEVLAALDELRASLPEGVEIQPLYRQSEFIHLSIDNLKEALRDGSIMVAVILFLFLLDFRITAITLTAIPLSLGITILVFDLLGLSVNSMTLGGLAVAVGMVVDDAIVDVENVYRRLRENAGRAEPLPKLEVIARASGEVRSSILYATVLIILVFLPLMALSGVEGRLFTPIAIATIVSMAASFVVSLTVIPVLSSFLLHPKAGREHRDFIVVRWLKTGFRVSWMKLALSQPILVLVITGALIWMSWTAYAQMGRNFLPAFREPTALVATTLSPGTSLKMTTELADVAQERLLRIPGVKSAGYRAGRAERGDHVVPVSTVEFDVEFDESAGRTHPEIVADIRDTMKGIPGTFSAMSGPLADRIGHMLSGVSAKVAVKVYGPDLDELRRIGEEIVEVARGIPGLEEARGEQQAPVSQLRIEPDPERAAAYAVTPGTLTGEMASLMAGEKVSEVYEGVRVYDLVVRLPQEWREDPERLEDFYVDTLDDKLVPLGSVADLRMASGPNNILRENSRRRFVVQINPTVSDLVSAVDRLKEEVTNKVALPEGYTLSYEGEYQAQKEASRTILIMSSVVLLVVIFLLYSYFRSLRFVGLVLTIIPVSLIGAVLSTQQTLDNVSIATLVGFIAVAGIAARNNIMLISHYLHLMRHEGEGFTRAMVIRGTEERLVPILMTALSAGLALIPLVLASDKPGKEILNPVAIVIVGGLLSSTLLGLAVTPALFFRFCRGAAAKALARNAAAAA
ncbi:CzcA family heavy metal efflux pump [Haloferula luteola]|uniref:CzcA family heavy metal efflux pump n=1 Tax=Haloferula luteola TaxID=595692 RepID=A0A840VAN4_9BACT|nr:efflux RND transporter permease subunit [Haloferula luteola]MBB5350859.1 CzcA family heavy metal efflux pump [Haloferula luteola]